MPKFNVTIKSIRKETHDVLQIRTEKPKGFEFQPGQATEIFIPKPGWEKEGRPFTFTSLPEDPHLEFNIKTYPERKGMTHQLLTLKANEPLILNDIFGAIEYKGEGTFIAGGAGITPFIAILRNLQAKNQIGTNKLIFANKTSKDIILKDEFEKMLKNNFINILSDEKTSQYASGFISESFIEKQSAGMNKKFYVCGPPPMMEAILKQLGNLGVKEKDIVQEAV